MTDSLSIIKEIDNIRFDPAGVQRLVLSKMEELSNGAVRLVDPTNPVAFTLEAAIVTMTAGVEEAGALTRRQYSSCAETYEDLYLHMSDRDHIDAFAHPSDSNFGITFLLEDIRKRAVAVPNSTSRLLRLPRNTEIRVGGSVFTFQYPVDIRVHAHDGLSISYNTDELSPLEVLSSNVVAWRVVKIQGMDYLFMEFPVKQFEIVTHYATLNNTTGFTKTYPFSDSYYYCRAYIQATGGEWVELLTTHTESVYDPTKPTIVLAVGEGELSVHVPLIYFNKGMLTDNIRLDIFTTKGELILELKNYDSKEFSIIWKDHDNPDGTEYTAPLATMAVSCYSSKNVNGGRAALSFDELRDRVMGNSTGASVVPVTPAQITTSIKDKGYELVLDMDAITRRIYMASRQLPSANLEGSKTPASCSIQMFQAPIDALIGLDTTFWNGAGRLTVLPQTLFRNINGVMSTVAQSSVDAILALDPDSRIAAVNSDTLMYTPFHYVMDITGETFDLRPYYLNSPSIKAKFFIDENTTPAIDVAIDTFKIQPSVNNDGYYLYITTRSGEVFQTLDHDGGQVQVQASFIPPGESTRAVLTGVDVTPPGLEVPERIYRFFIGTNYDINDKHQLMLTSFHMYDTSPRTIPAPLDLQLDLIFVVRDFWTPDTKISNLDNLVLPFEIPASLSTIAVIQERMELQLGHFLKGLWHRCRSVIGDLEYARYPNDVPAYYEKDVFETDITGLPIIGWDAGTSTITTNRLHRLGEPIITSPTTNATAEVTLAGQAIVNFTTGAFTSGDEGKAFVFKAAGLAGVDLYGTILTVTDSNTIVLSTDVLEDTDVDGTFIYGDQALKHHANDVVYDAFGQPTMVGTTTDRGMFRQSDMFFIDGKYRFATDDATLVYAKSIPELIRDWVTTDIAEITRDLHERTELLLFPKATIGKIPVVVRDGVKTLIDAEQSFVVTIYVTKENHDNAELRKSMTRTTLEIITQQLGNETIAKNVMENTLHTAFGTNAVSVSIDGLGGSDNIVAMTMVNSAVKPSIRKKLTVLSDQTIAIEDDVNVVFVKHLG